MDLFFITKRFPEGYVSREGHTWQDMERVLRTGATDSAAVVGTWVVLGAQA